MPERRADQHVTAGRAVLVAGVAAGVAAGGSALRGSLADGQTPVVLAIVAGLVVGGVAAWIAVAAVRRGLAVAAGLAQGWRAHPGIRSRPTLAGLAAVLAAAAAAGLAAVLRSRPGGWRLDPVAALPGAGDAALALLPVAAILLLAVWLLRLAGPLAAGLARPRLGRRRLGSPALLADVVSAALVGGALFLLLNRDLLGTQAVTALVVPALGAAGVLTWRAMGRSARLPVRAGADVVLSLVLGADVAILLVWIANLLDLAPAEVSALRGGLERVRAAADVPWWAWALLYAALAGASLATALRPERLDAVLTWSRRLRVVPSIEVGRRAISAVHVGLLATSLVALAGPPALAPGLRDQVRARYAVALQQEFDAAGARSAADAIRAAASGGTLPAAGRQSLASVLTRVHQVAGAPARGAAAADATPDERALAREVGRLQALTLRPRAAPAPVLAHEQAAAELRALDRPIAGADDLDRRLDGLAAREQAADRGREQLRQAAELAAVAVASTAQIQVPGLSDSALVQVVQEYVAGIVESSPVKELFFEWAQRLWFTRSSPEEPPAGTRLATPDPVRLQIVAMVEVTRLRLTLIARGDPPADPPLAGWADEPAPVAVVDIVDEIRVLRARAAACPGCHGAVGRPGEPGRPRERPPVHPVEPHPVRV